MTSKWIVTIAVIVFAAAHGNAQVVTSFNDAVQPVSPAPGWAFLWNSTGGFGFNPANLTPLIYTGDANLMYTADGDTNIFNPPSGPLFIGRVGGVAGGHPGLSDLTGGGFSRFPYARYTVPISGPTSITNSFITNAAPGDGVTVNVFLNGDPVPVASALTSPGTGSSAAFDYNFGNLTAGDQIYVSVGNGFFGNIDNDSYTMNYTITTVPEPTSMALMGLASAAWVGGRFFNGRRVRQVE